jgi:hypothetical protein
MRNLIITGIIGLLLLGKINAQTRLDLPAENTNTYAVLEVNLRVAATKKEMQNAIIKEKIGMPDSVYFYSDIALAYCSGVNTEQRFIDSMYLYLHLAMQLIKDTSSSLKKDLLAYVKMISATCLFPLNRIKEAEILLIEAISLFTNYNERTLNYTIFCQFLLGKANFLQTQYGKAEYYYKTAKMNAWNNYRNLFTIKELHYPTSAYVNASAGCKACVRKKSRYERSTCRYFEQPWSYQYKKK